MIAAGCAAMSSWRDMSVDPMGGTWQQRVNGCLVTMQRLRYPQPEGPKGNPGSRLRLLGAHGCARARSRSPGALGGKKLPRFRSAMDSIRPGDALNEQVRQRVAV